MSGGESKVWCCKEEYYIGTCNVRFMNQGKLDVVKQEMTRFNIDIWGISELKWRGFPSGICLQFRRPGFDPLGWEDPLEKEMVRTGHLPTWGVHLSVSYLFAFSYCSWYSHGKNTGVVCYFLLQWTMYCQKSSLWPIHRGWPCMAWLTASLSYVSSFTTTSLWPTKGDEIMSIYKSMNISKCKTVTNLQIQIERSYFHRGSPQVTPYSNNHHHCLTLLSSLPSPVQNKN